MIRNREELLMADSMTRALEKLRKENRIFYSEDDIPYLNHLTYAILTNLLQLTGINAGNTFISCLTSNKTKIEKEKVFDEAILLARQFVDALA